MRERGSEGVREAGRGEGGREGVREGVREGEREGGGRNEVDKSKGKHQVHFVLHYKPQHVHCAVRFPIQQ